MSYLLRVLFSPVLFGLAFLAPLVAQSLLAAGLLADSQQAYVLGFAVGGSLGLMAQVRGSWLWVQS